MKAFGKLDLNSPLPLRSFESYFGIEARKGPRAWRSAYPSVQKLLDHLARYTKSDSSREKYLNLLRRFCIWCAIGPERLVSFPKAKVESLIQRFADNLSTEGRSKAYVNSVIKRLKTFFRANGFSGKKELNVATHFVPARYRRKPEYVPSKEEVLAMADSAGSIRNRALILFLWSSGLRVSTVSALDYADIAEELEEGCPCVKIPVYPEMKLRVPDACKGNIPYYTFICREATEALRAYLRERAEKYGSVAPDDPLFHSEWNFWGRKERSGKRLGRRAIAQIVRRAAKIAGILRWEHITPHCLRKAFESVLRSPTSGGGRMDKGTQEFLMGHILPGSQDAYYDRSKVDFHRNEYAKLDFSAGEPSSTKSKDKLIDGRDLERYLGEGWTFVAKVGDDKFVVRRSG